MNRTFRIKSEEKYSNINVFEKREKEFKIKMRDLYYSKLKKKPKLNYGWLKKLIRRNSNFGIPILSTSTTYLISDKNTQLSLREKFFKRMKLDKKLLNNYKNKKSNNRISLEKTNLFITESPIIKSLSKNFSSFNITSRKSFNTRRRKNKLITSSKSPENHKSFNYFLFNNFSGITNAKILLHFENEKILANSFVDGENINKNFSKKKNFSSKLIRMNSSGNYDKMLDFKINQLNIHKDRTSKLISKTKELKLFEYNMQLKKERNKRLKEIRENNIDSLNEKMDSLFYSKELLNNTFIDKLSEYIKFINSRMESEKDESIALINQIIKFKNDVKQLENKIEKKIEEKNCILKWIYFQIQIKEKKICLPSYYKTIIEKNEFKRGEARKKNIGLGFSKSSKQLTKANKKISPKIKQYKKLDNNLNNDSKLFFHSSIDLNNPVNIKEIKKIRNYKNNLIFNSVDELEDVFVSMENKIIEMMKYYGKLKLDIIYLKKNLSIIKNNLQQNENYNNNSYKTKEEEINELKNYFKSQIKIMQKLNINKFRNSVSNNFISKDNFYIYKENNRENYIINKINNVYKNCKSLGIKFVLGTDEEKQDKKQDKKHSKNTSTLNDIMSKLKFINLTIDYILTKFRNYDNKKKNKLKELRKEVERSHKIKNTIDQKIQNSKNFVEKQNKIIERNNKIYFLPYRKIELYKNKNTKKSIDLYERKSQKIQFYDLID